MGKITEVNVAKNFTLNGIGFGPDALQEFVAAHPGETPIVNAMIFAVGYEKKVNKQDPTKFSYRFEGDFECVNRHTGETLRTSGGYFPGVVESFVKGQVDAVEAGGVRLAVMITVRKVPVKESNTGYKFGMKTYIDEDAAQDHFKEIRSVFPAMKALPAGKEKVKA